MLRTTSKWGWRLVVRRLPKLNVAGSNPVSRSILRTPSPPRFTPEFTPAGPFTRGWSCRSPPPNGLSPAEIVRACEQAAKNALLDHRTQISTADLTDAIADRRIQDR